MVEGFFLARMLTGDGNGGKLLLFFESQLLNLLVIEVFIISFVNFSHLVISLEKKVVAGGDMIVFVGVDVLDCVVLFEVVVAQQVQDLRVHGDLGEAHENPPSDLLVLNLRVPRVLSYVCYFESFLRVSVENVGNEVSALRRHKVGNFVVSIENLLV